LRSATRGSAAPACASWRRQALGRLPHLLAAHALGDKTQRLKQAHALRFINQTRQ